VARRFALVLATAAAALAAAPGASAACTRWASSHGSDQSTGTARAPFLTVQRLLEALPSGGIGCLKGGSVFRARVWLTRPATLQSFGGRATIVGNVTIGRGAANVVIQGLTIRGSRGRASIDVRGDRARIVGDDISGPGFRDRSTPCVVIDGVHGVVIDGNRIHGCTLATRKDLYAPGVLVVSAVRTRITNNVVFHTVGDGIALAPNAQRSRVEHNLVDGNVSGISLGGNEQTASSYNVVAHNILSNSGRWNVRSAWHGRIGTRNVVESNCLWNGFGGNVATSGVLLRRNRVANPRLRNRLRSYALAWGPCVAMRPRIVPVEIHALPQFRVAYRLRALPARVQVVRLGLTGITPGANVTVRCRRGCAASWHGTARTSSLELPVLRAAWLTRGSVVEIRARRFGFAGSYARVVVTGLPHGLRVEHACLAPNGTIPVSCGRYT
jgi:parallel beta helix pectate lyase-like protein